MKSIYTLLLVIPMLFLSTFSQADSTTVPIADTPDSLWNLNENGFIFNGYDVVSVFNKETYPLNRSANASSGDSGGYFPSPLKGNPEIVSSWKNIKLAFANQANKQRFDSTPEQLKPYFLPKFGGYCAKAMASGYLVDIKPEASMVIPDHNGNLVFFTQANKIARTSNIQNLDELYPVSEKNWNKLQDGDPQKIAEAKAVGIAGMAEAGFNALKTFFSTTPEPSELRLVKP